jgi:N-acetylneuraminate synthase
MDKRGRQLRQGENFMNETTGVFIIAEVGINHNGDLELAKRLTKEAKEAGCDAVKFQKRTIELVYTPEDLERPRESPFGTTNRDQKQGLEFSKEQYDEIDAYCKEIGIEWFASAWDLESQEFMRRYNLKYNKVASPMLRVLPLLHKIAEEGKYTFISTGMSILEEIDEAVEIFKSHNCPFELMHCNSSYPMNNEEANLNAMATLRERYSCDVGYSGHERGVQISIAAVALGATSVERHITVDRSMYGSDQAASLGLTGLNTMVRDIRTVSTALGDGIKRIYESELASRSKLATPYWYKLYLEEH